jgi:hypothetical protein
MRANAFLSNSENFVLNFWFYNEFSGKLKN